MLKTYQYNLAHKLNLIPVFELKNIFHIKKTKLTCLLLDQYIIDNISKSLININIIFIKLLYNK